MNKFPPDRKCLNCKKNFKPFRHTSFFCCKRCRYIYSRNNGTNKYEKKINIYKNKECQLCKKEFTPNSHNQKYCCKECLEKSNKNVVNGSKLVIFLRDGFTCIYCGRSSIEDGVRLHIDHIIPVSKGGEDVASNLITSCEQCNVQKGTKIIELKRIIEVVRCRNIKSNISDTATIKSVSSNYRVKNLIKTKSVILNQA
jgi:5-methylcytosine-specific restriction endonuclease McrA